MSGNVPPVTISGIGSVSPYGPLAGLISATPLEPAAITSWKTAELRRGFLVPPFRATEVVPGVKVRRLDRLSAWALVASALAIQDAGIDLQQIDLSRVAVVFATAFGCIELTEAFYLSAAARGWSGTDPITFPETLASAPASHVSMFHGLRGPNLTVSNKYFAAECALMQAASLLRRGQADVAIVLSGEALARSLFAWYEESGALSPACYNANPVPEVEGFIPSEGVAAFVIESPSRIEARPGARSYARITTGRWAAGSPSAESIRRLTGGSAPTVAICSGNGAPCAVSSPAALISEIIGDACSIVKPNTVAQGLAGSGGLFHLMFGLAGLSSNVPFRGQALLLGTARDNGFAAIVLESP